MAAKKSAIRIAAESALEPYDGNDNYCCWIDRSKSGHRVKFYMAEPGNLAMLEMRKHFAASFPQQDTRVWYVQATRNMGYGGLAFKVFN